MKDQEPGDMDYFIVRKVHAVQELDFCLGPILGSLPSTLLIGQAEATPLYKGQKFPHV